MELVWNRLAHQRGIDVAATGSLALRPMVDLNTVPSGERASAWSSHTASLFPGASVLNLPSRPTQGEIARVPLGDGVLWYIQAPPSVFQYRPAAVSCLGPPGGLSFGLIAQVTGVLSASQSGRECALEPGDLCFLDARDAFRIEGADSSEFIVLELPRDAVTGTHPLLGSHTACAFKEKNPGTTLLRNTVMGVARAAPRLSPSQRVSGLAGILGMLGMVDQVHELGVSMDRRILHALAHIESHLTDKTLSAATLAATLGITRRRLDDLFATALGCTAAAQIWQRRFAHAAALLRDPHRPQQQISEIAHASGFEDTGHFVRAFKRRYGQTPGKWRSTASQPT